MTPQLWLKRKNSISEASKEFWNIIKHMGKMSRTWGLVVKGRSVSDFGLVNHTVILMILADAGLLEEILSIKFLGLTLVNKIIQVLSVHFYDSWSSYCIACSPSEVISSSVTIYLTFFPLYSFPPPSPLANTIIYIYESLVSCFCLFVHLLLSVLHHAYEWNHMVIDFFFSTYFI